MAPLRWAQGCALVGMVGALAGCEMPLEEPAAPPAEVATPAPDRRVAFYEKTEKAQRAAGKLRQDRTPSDAPLSEALLAQSFIRIALYDEETGRSMPLTRWRGSVTVSLVPGSDGSGTQDLATLRRYAMRLSRATGLRIRIGPVAQADILVMVLTRPEQRALADRFRRDGGDAAIAPVLEAFLLQPLTTPCSVTTYVGAEALGEIRRAVAVIAGETRGLTRRACFEEEIAQALGLRNDRRDARPSIFNDDEEFALLTLHDEILLRILYDPRLSPGMQEADIRPLLPQIVRDAMTAAGAPPLIATAS